MRLEPRWLSQAKQHEKISDVQAISKRVRQAYNTIGCQINEESDAALLADALCHDCPIVGATKGFLDLTGHSREHILGKNCRFLLSGVPEVAVSKSARKNIKDFCRMCRLRGLHQIAEATAVQPNIRQDGSHFVNAFIVGMCRINDHPYIIGVQVSVGEGLLARIPQDRLLQITEETRIVLRKLRRRLGCSEPSRLQAEPPISPPVGFRWFAERLQDHCLLLNDGITALRREPQELVSNCLVFGDAPVRHTLLGLFFRVRVDDVVETFEGLPILGFTSRKPVDNVDLYPAVSKCLGKSVLVGTAGEAWARDQHHHFKMGFKKPAETEVASWALDQDKPPHKRKPPVVIQAGDTLGVLYMNSGRIQLWCNRKKILDFDIHRPVCPDADYYAVADVCFAAYSLTILPLSFFDEIAAAVENQTDAELVPNKDHTEAGPSWICEPPPRALNHDRPADIETKVRTVVHDAFVQNAIRAAVMKCGYCVTIADPRGKDIPLIAVSETFEKMTGFARREILGVNCRFLGRDSPISSVDIVGLRIASQTGAPFTALLPNRKKNGDLFVNMLDLRGLIVAQDPVTNDPLWYLVGIQADVTDIDGAEVSEGHFAALQEMALLIREQCKYDLLTMVAQSSNSLESEAPQATSDSIKPGNAGSDSKPLRNFTLLEQPVWMTGSEASQGNGCIEKLKVTMPPETLQEVLNSNSSMHHRSTKLQLLLEAYMKETKSSQSLPLSKRFFLEEWKTWLRAYSSTRCSYMSIGVTAIFIGVSVFSLSRNSQRLGRCLLGLPYLTSD